MKYIQRREPFTGPRADPRNLGRRTGPVYMPTDKVQRRTNWGRVWAVVFCAVFWAVVASSLYDRLQPQ